MVSVLQPFCKQVSISKDFIERHQGCRVSRIFVSGGLSLLNSWTQELGAMLHAEIVRWDPFENIQYDTDSIPPEIQGQTTRFAAAIGSAIGGFEDQ